MEKRTFEVWVDLQNKTVSFRQVSEWPRQQYESEKSMMEQLDRFMMQGFRFQ